MTKNSGSKTKKINEPIEIIAEGNEATSGREHIHVAVPREVFVRDSGGVNLMSIRYGKTITGLQLSLQRTPH